MFDHHHPLVCLYAMDAENNTEDVDTATDGNTLQSESRKGAKP